MIALTCLFILGAGFICSCIWVVWRDLRAAAADITFIEDSYWIEAVRALAATP